MPLPTLMSDATGSPLLRFCGGPPADGELRELLTVEDVATLLKVSKQWVYERTRSRGTPQSQRLPHLKVGKYLRFEACTVRAFLEKTCRTT